MAKIYLVRHQCAGVLTSFAFASPPTDAQKEPLIADARRVSGQDGWVELHEMELLADEVPRIASATGPGASLLPIVISGTGTVA